MAGITFKAELSDQQARDRLASLAERMENMFAFYKRVGEYMVEEAIPRNFASESGPDGTPWARLSPVTLARRQRSGSTATTILQNTNRLRNSISARPSENQLLIGSSVDQAAVMQFGAAQGAFGSMSNGSPIPWGTIPARPYLGFSGEDGQEVIRIAEDWLEA